MSHQCAASSTVCVPPLPGLATTQRDQETHVTQLSVPGLFGGLKNHTEVDGFLAEI